MNIFVGLVVLIVGVLLGQLSVWVALHRRFNVPMSEQIWSMLRIKSYHKLGSVKLVIAENHDQFRVWLAGNVKYVRCEEDLRGYDPEDVEIIKTGLWWNSPVASSLDLCMLEIKEL